MTEIKEVKTVLEHDVQGSKQELQQITMEKYNLQNKILELQQASE